MLQHILLFVGIGFTNPFVPDFGTQFITATIIGTVVPKVIVSPLHCFLLKVPLLGAGICKFEQKLEDTEKLKIPFTDRKIDLSGLKTGFSRLLAGYFLTYIIGGICLLLCFYTFGCFQT